MQLKGRQDRWRLLLPDELIPEEIEKKYANVLQARHSFFYKPIDFLNESVQKIQVLGINSAVLMQAQTRRGDPLRIPKRVNENDFLHSSGDFPFRSAQGPLSLIDKTLNVDFRMEAGFLNYFLIFESFFYHYSRDTESIKLPQYFPIEIYNEDGDVYAKLMLYDPVIDGMDMLDLDFTQPVAQSQTFRVIFKYGNIDLQFIKDDAVTKEKVDNPITRDDIVIDTIAVK